MYTVHTGCKDLDNLLLDIDCSLIHCTLDVETEACAALYALARQAPVCYALQLHIIRFLQCNALVTQMCKLYY